MKSIALVAVLLIAFASAALQTFEDYPTPLTLQSYMYNSSCAAENATSPAFVLNGICIAEGPTANLTFITCTGNMPGNLSVTVHFCPAGCQDLTGNATADLSGCSDITADANLTEGCNQIEATGNDALLLCNSRLPDLVPAPTSDIYVGLYSSDDCALVNLTVENPPTNFTCTYDAGLNVTFRAQCNDGLPYVYACAFDDTECSGYCTEQPYAALVCNQAAPNLYAYLTCESVNATAETDTETDTETATDSEAATDSETDSEVATDSETDSEAPTDSEAETDSETDSEAETDSETDSEAETDSETDSEVATDSEEEPTSSDEPEPESSSSAAPPTSSTASTSSSTQKTNPPSPSAASTYALAPIVLVAALLFF